MPHLGSILLGSDPGAFLCDGAFHQQHDEHQRDHHNGQHPEHIEVGERRCLLLAQVLMCLALLPLLKGAAVGLCWAMNIVRQESAT